MIDLTDKWLYALCTCALWESKFKILKFLDFENCSNCAKGTKSFKKFYCKDKFLLLPLVSIITLKLKSKENRCYFLKNIIVFKILTQKAIKNKKMW